MWKVKDIKRAKDTHKHVCGVSVSVSEENSIYLVLTIGCAIVVIGGYNRGDSIGVRSPMLRAQRVLVWIRFRIGIGIGLVGSRVVFD